MRKIALLVLFLFVGGCAELPLQQASVQVIQSPNDDREYQYLVLDNQMKVLLVSDPEADKAAAALTVGVGSTANPEDRAGLAHFLEHMLFMGTEKYPGVDEYAAFIDRHGGSHNAFTAENITTYFFDIKHQELEPALDRFAQFFVAPLFSEKYVEREKNAVQSEYQLKLKEDSRRIHAAQQKALNPESPYARFSVGSLETLSDRADDKVRDDLIDFYQRYYSANQMSLVVLGREPLDQLRAWAVEKFSPVPNQHLSRFVPSASLFQAGQLPARVDIVPLKEIHRLELEFPLPSTLSHYRVHPLTYLAHFIGHEGEGSLLSVLKRKGWATKLNAGGSSLDTREALFQISIDLTPAGLDQVEAVTSQVFQYIRLLREQGIEKWRYAEQQRKSELAFRFKEKISPAYYAMGLSGKLQDYPPEDVLRVSGLMEHYDQALIEQYAARLVPENLLMTVISPKLETTEVESNYGVHYAVRPLDQALVDRLGSDPVDEGLGLPAANPFIPDQVALKEPVSDQPVPYRVAGSARFTLWHQQDEQFGVPKAGMAFTLKSPVANDTARHQVMKSLMVDLYKQQLNEFAYPASIAGLNYSLTSIGQGMRISVYGYDQKQGILLEKIVQALGAPEFTAETFAIRKSNLQRKLKNKALDRPYKQVLSARKRFLVAPGWTPRERLKALESVTLEALMEYRDRFFSKLEITALSYGNRTEEEALALTRVVEQGLPDEVELISVAKPQLKILGAEARSQENYEVAHPDSVLITYFQGENKSIEEHARWRLLGQVMSSPFFTELRTEQQLGYAVAAAYTEDERMPGLVQLVQSSSVSAKELDQRMNRFTSEFANELEAMEAEEFERNKEGLINELVKKDSSYLKTFLRYLDNLERENLTFDFKRQLAAAVADLDRSALAEFYRHSLLQQPRAAIIYSKGERDPAAPVLFN